MADFTAMLRVEALKAWRSRMPLWTALGASGIPLGIGLLISVARNRALAEQLGLLSAKADMLNYAAADWTGYLGTFSLFFAAGGLMLFSLVFSWTFGREFADRTLKDLLAVPVARVTILAAKFSVAAVWSLALAVLMLLLGLVIGAGVGLPGGSPAVILAGGAHALATALLVLVSVTPVGYLAGAGRGYLLPLGVTMLVLLAANLLAVIHLAGYFPWGVAGLFALDQDPLGPVNYFLLVLTAVAGVVATVWWWTTADQPR